MGDQDDPVGTRATRKAGASGLGRVGRVFRARRAHSPEKHTFRLSSSIRLTWGLGLATFLILSIAIGFLTGRVSEEEFRVPRALEDFQAQITQDAAQSVRRSVNEGVDDLTQFAAVVSQASGRKTTSVVQEAGALDEGSPEEALTDDRSLRSLLAIMQGVHGRYLSMYVLSPEGVVAAEVGAEPVTQGFDPAPPFDAPGVQQFTNPDGGDIVVVEYAPLALTDGEVASVAGQYDTEFLAFALEGAVPGDAWVVDGEGNVIASLQPTGFVRLPRQSLTEAADRARAGEAGAFVTGESIDHLEIVGYAPVAGAGPASELGWSVVTTRAVAGLSLPQSEARSQGLLAGLVLGFVTVLVFGWLYIIIVNPVVRLQHEAERMAYGDLSRAVEVIRYDEIGLTARALERLRILLIRRPGQDRRVNRREEDT